MPRYAGLLLQRRKEGSFEEPVVFPCVLSGVPLAPVVSLSIALEEPASSLTRCVTLFMIPKAAGSAKSVTSS